MLERLCFQSVLTLHCAILKFLKDLGHLNGLSLSRCCFVWETTILTLISSSPAGWRLGLSQTTLEKLCIQILVSSLRILDVVDSGMCVSVCLWVSVVDSYEMKARPALTYKRMQHGETDRETAWLKVFSNLTHEVSRSLGVQAFVLRISLFLFFL